MLDRSVRYVASGGGQVAYSVFGSGPLDLLLVGHYTWHLEAIWDYPDAARFYERLASFARVVMWNVRGVGLSDRVDTGQATLDSGLEDVSAVLDTLDIDHPAVFGVGSGIPLAVLFAGTHPARVRSMVLSGGWLKPSELLAGQDLESVTNDLIDSWGTGLATAAVVSPTRLDNPEYVAWLARMERFTATPKTGADLFRAWLATDISQVLPTISTPTLVIHMSRSPSSDQRLAEQIPSARYVEIDGDQDWCGTDDGRVADEVEEFLTGNHHLPDADRVLATVLFTDIVRSTERAIGLGDRKWRELLDAHDALIRRQLDRFRGQEVKTVGDGFLATFDGPGRAIRCACAIRDSVRALDIHLRSGLHTGEIEIRAGDIAGMAVHVAQRISALAQPDEVLVSRTVTDLVAGSSFTFESRGQQELRGLPNSWTLFAVTG